MTNNLKQTDFLLPRNDSLDFMKMIGMILVVLIHTFSLTFWYPNQQLLYRIIVLLADPIFFFVSGYIFWQKNYHNGRFKHFAFRQSLLLLVFVTFALLKFLIHLGIDYINYFDFFVYPHKGLWFIFSLFFIRWFAFFSIFVSSFVFSKATPFLKSILPILVFIALMCLPFSLYLAFGDVFELGHSVAYSSFFVLGWLISVAEKEESFSKHYFLKAIFAFVCVIVFTVLFLIIEKIDWFANYSFGIVAFRLVISAFGVLGIHFICSLICKFKIFSKASMVGKYSLGVYFFGCLIIDFAYVRLSDNLEIHSSSALNLLLYFLAILCLSILLSFAIYYLFGLTKKSMIKKST